MKRLVDLLSDAQSSGDAEIQDRAWQEITRRVRLYVRAASLTSPEDSMAVASSVILPLWVAVGSGHASFSEDAKLDAYLRLAVQHRIVDRHRRRTSGTRGGGIPHLPIGGNGMEGEVEPAGDELTASQIARNEELFARARQILGARAFDEVLDYLGGAGHEEAARARGSTPDAVRMRIQRCLRRLREALGPELGGGD